MREVELYFNESPGSQFVSYTPQATMRLGERRRMELPADDQEALDETWIFFNRDDRPNGAYERSLSMADVITLDCKRSYAITATGFREVPLLTGHEVVTSLQWQEEGSEGAMVDLQKFDG